ncbi:protein-tyrosine phosphatase-like protein [Mycena epipterygia]|nr:protein-tyrosine phosphatase-like protein [Mycena epipterygia]
MACVGVPPYSPKRIQRSLRRAVATPYRRSRPLVLSLSVLNLAPGAHGPKKTHTHSASAPCISHSILRSCSTSASRASCTSSSPSTVASFPLPPSPSIGNGQPWSYSQITPHLSISDLTFAETPGLLHAAGITHVVSVLDKRVIIPPNIPSAHRLHVPLPDFPFAELVGALDPIVRWVRDVLVAHGAMMPHSGKNFWGTHGAAADEISGEKSKCPEGDYIPLKQHVRILVHCAQGISRSPAVGAALLVALPMVCVAEGWEEDALEAASAQVHVGQEHAGLLDASETRTPRTLSAAGALAYVAGRRPAADVNWGFRAQLKEWEAVCRTAALEL